MIDENALIRLLEAGEIGGAGLDVFEHEPAVSPKLVRLAKQGKVVLLPHMGSATLEGRIDMARRSSSTSRPSWTATARRTACSPPCCEGARAGLRVDCALLCVKGLACAVHA